MIWLIALGSSLYTLILLLIGFWLRGKLTKSVQQSQAIHQEEHGKILKPLATQQSESGPLKAITPLERSLEQSKEIRERIEHLIS